LGLPLTTTVYLALNVLTWTFHFLLAGYVLVGTGWLVVCGVRGEISHLVRDWLAVAFGAAITLAVAPLLFTQILYKVEFYTAQTLLRTMWMTLGPTLIVAFYLLYLLKVHRVDVWPLFVGRLIALVALACFVFAAYCWTVNHLTSLDPKAWPEIYVGTTSAADSEGLLMRLGLWLSVMLVSFASVISWQLWSLGRPVPTSIRNLGLVGVGLSVTTLIGFTLNLPEAPRAALLGVFGGPYFGLAVLGLLGAAALWFIKPQSAWPALAAIIACGGFAGIREAVRIATLHADGKLEALFDRHQSVADFSGSIAFIVFFVMNAVIIGTIITVVTREVRRQERAEAAGKSESTE
jgi:hypothetical protein